MDGLASREVSLPPVHWRVSHMGEGPDILFLHGAGGAAFNWHPVMALLADRFRVTAPDLPGHGASRRGPSRRMGLAPMAEDLGRLVTALDLKPVAIVGHSAGAALMLQLCLQGARPGRLIAVNAALAKFPGMAAWLFPVLAKGLAMNPLVAPVVSRMAGPGAVGNLLKSTGSTLDAETTEAYRKLMRDPRHIDGALTMMANWSLDELRDALPQIRVPTTFITGARDKTVPPEVSDEASEMMPHARIAPLAGLGHLAHEEAPELIAGMIAAELARVPAGTA